MEGIVNDFRGPFIVGRVVRGTECKQARAGALPPAWWLGAAALKRSNEQFAIPVAVDVTPADAVQGRLGADGVQAPFAGRVVALTKPLQRPCSFGVARLPIGSQSDVQLAVAIDVVRRQTHMVRDGGSVGDDVFLPTRVFKPHHLVLAAGHDVGLAVSVDVGNNDAVADAEFRFENLLAEMEAGFGRFGSGFD